MTFTIQTCQSLKKIKLPEIATFYIKSPLAKISAALFYTSTYFKCTYHTKEAA